jgi:hypothetical protein
LLISHAPLATIAHNLRIVGNTEREAAGGGHAKRLQVRTGAFTTVDSRAPALVCSTRRPMFLLLSYRRVVCRRVYG